MGVAWGKGVLCNDGGGEPCEMMGVIWGRGSCEIMGVVRRRVPCVMMGVVWGRGPV